MTEPFIGSEALQAGRVTNKYRLSTRYQPLFPGVYGPAGTAPNLRQRTTAAWLWSDRHGVIGGQAAAALHGTRWIDGAEPVDMLSSRSRAPRGIRIRRDALLPGEQELVDGLPVTTPERTAFDIGRWSRDVPTGVTRLDALANATGFDPGAVAVLAGRHEGSPGVRQLREVLRLHDPGGQSPRESRLRLLLVGAGFPAPRTQIPVFDDAGYPHYYLDMGWEDVMIAVEYDGDHHRDREVWPNDIVRSEFIGHRGWIHIRVVAGTRPSDVVHRVRRAWESRR